MDAITRRSFCGAALAVTAAPALAARKWVTCPDGSIVQSGTACLTSPSPTPTEPAPAPTDPLPTSPTAEPEPAPSSTTATSTQPVTAATDYQTTLGIDGLTPNYPTWNGRKWSAAMKSTSTAGLDYCWRVTEKRSRFELRALETRSELHESRTKLPNGVSMWGAFNYLDQPWPNPAGMQAGTGGCLTQMHWPGSGSPAFAFRRSGDGKLVITTRGDGETNTKRYEGAMAVGVPHDFVYRFVLGVQGELDVWLDGTQILNFRGPVGSATPGCYWCIGCYYAGGTGGNTVIQEYGNHVFPTTASLADRAAAPLTWPTN